MDSHLDNSRPSLLVGKRRMDSGAIVVAKFFVSKILGLRLGCKESGMTDSHLGDSRFGT
jgi:hypothetical protein